jgi:hypothetical protein
MGVFPMSGEYAKLNEKDKKKVDAMVEERQLDALLAVSNLREPTVLPTLKKELRSAKTLTRWKDEIAEDLVLVRKRAVPLNPAFRLIS